MVQGKDVIIDYWAVAYVWDMLVSNVGTNASPNLAYCMLSIDAFYNLLKTLYIKPNY